MTVFKLPGFLGPPARRLIAMILLLSPSATALVIRWRLEVLTFPSRPASIRATALTGSRRLRIAKACQPWVVSLFDEDVDLRRFDVDSPRPPSRVPSGQRTAGRVRCRTRGGPPEGGGISLTRSPTKNPDRPSTIFAAALYTPLAKPFNSLARQSDESGIFWMNRRAVA